MELAHPFTLGAGMVFLAAGIMVYRRRSRESGAQGSQYGSQGAVIMIIIGAILAIHGLGLLEYRPMGSEL